MTEPQAIACFEDHELIELISVARSREALAELYERYRHSLGGFLRTKLYNEKLIDEVYNDVMMTIWEKSENFRGDSKVSTWIFGIAYRICLSNVRKETKHTRNAVDYEFDGIAAEQEPNMNEPLRAAISELSDDHRMVIELAYYYGHSIVEIAEIVACPANTVKTRLFHARQNLKTIIEADINPDAV